MAHPGGESLEYRLPSPNTKMYNEKTLNTLLRLFQIIFSLFWEENYCYCIIKAWALISLSLKYLMKNPLWLIEWSDRYLANRLDPHFHIMNNEMLVLRLRINHFTIPIHLSISVTTVCCCAGPAAQMMTVIWTRDPLQRIGLREQWTSFWLPLNN